MVIKDSVYFSPAEEYRTLHIHLPDDYETSSIRYPVMYYFDGHNIFHDEDATYGKSWGLEDFLETWPKDIIIVGIECNHHGNDRLKEYCPYEIWGHSFFGNLKGTGKVTAAWIVNVLKPMIDSQYRTYPFREATGIAGSSMGGLMSLYAVIAHNDVFSKAACLSSSLSACMNNLRKEIEDASISPDTRIYMSSGAREKGRFVCSLYRCLDTMLAPKGVTTTIYLQKGGRHCEADWEKQNALYMDFLWRS